jgi:DNA-directed RNA polymerase II subunit RPB2
MIYRGSNMPFSIATGEAPDIIMNPHAYPSRMTGGQVMESTLGKIAAVTGTPRDATTFYGGTIADISAELLELGLHPLGEERMVNPKTGEVMQAAIFMGFVYYQTLKHLVEEKVHARARGPVTKFNKQPVEGRRREGGLRLGEMEKDTLIAHGAAQLLQERTRDVSDAFDIPMCLNCGELHAHAEATAHESYYCPNCDSRDNIQTDTIPYVWKQFVRLALGEGVNIRLEFCSKPIRDPERFC